MKKVISLLVCLIALLFLFGNTAYAENLHSEEISFKYETKEEEAIINNSNLELKSNDDLNLVSGFSSPINFTINNAYGDLYYTGLRTNDNYTYHVSNNGDIVAFDLSNGEFRLLSTFYEYNYVYLNQTTNQYDSIIYGLLKNSKNGNYQVMGYDVIEKRFVMSVILKGLKSYNPNSYFAVDSKKNIYISSSDGATMYSFDKDGYKLSEISLSNYAKTFNCISPYLISQDGKLAMMYMNAGSKEYMGFVKLNGNGKITGNGIISLLDPFQYSYFIGSNRWVDEHSNIYSIDTTTGEVKNIWNAGITSPLFLGSYSNNGYVYTRMPGNRILKINASTLKVEWNISLGANKYLRQIKANNGKVYIYYSYNNSEYVTSINESEISKLNSKTYTNGTTENNFYTNPPSGYCSIESIDSIDTWTFRINQNIDYKLYDFLNLKVKLTIDGITDYVESDCIYYDSDNDFYYYTLPKKVLNALTGGKGNDKYLNGKKINVEILGLTDTYGAPLTFSYWIEFYANNIVNPTNLLMFPGKGYYLDDDMSHIYFDNCLVGLYDLGMYFLPDNVTDKRVDYTITNKDMISSIDLEKNYIMISKPGTTDIVFKRTSNGQHLVTLTINCVGYEDNPSFPDVEKGKWYYDSVFLLAKSRIMNGYTSGANKGKFGTKDPITRAQVVTALYRLLGEPDVSNYTNPFSDVPNNKYYTNAVIWANANGIVKGYESNEKFGKFGPDNNITRQELAVILKRIANFYLIDTKSNQSLNSFKDKNNVSSWALDAIKWAVENGIITGNDKLGKNNLRLLPKDTATRAEVATMITRFYLTFIMVKF